MNREPLMKKATWTGIAAAVIVVLVAVGVPIDDELKIAIVTLVGAAAPLIAGLWARPDVTPLVDPRDAEGNSLLEGWS